MAQLFGYRGLTLEPALTQTNAVKQQAQICGKQTKVNGPGGQKMEGIFFLEVGENAWPHFYPLNRRVNQCCVILWNLRNGKTFENVGVCFTWRAPCMLSYI